MIPMNGNAFFTGIVENVDDPDHNGRVQVRIIGIHSDNKAILPTAMLPWADVMGAITSASISGKGQAPVGMVCGTMVFGIFKDGSNYQEPFVMGTMGGFREIYQNASFGFNDPNGQYPIPGVTGDVNILAGGLGDTGATSDGGALSAGNPVQATTDTPDPTEPQPTLDPNAYKDTPWMPIAQSQLGVNEADNVDKIKQYHLIGGGTMREVTVAWCAAFANWCLIQAGITGTRSAASRSFMNFGVSVGKTNVPYGAIAVFGVPSSGSGHVAFVLQDTGSSLVCLGGNQSDKSHRSGGQVSRTTIPKNGSSLVLLDCRMPTNLDAKKST